MAKKEAEAFKDIKSDKEGFLEHQKPSADPKKKPQWKKIYFRLVGGSLYYYKNEKDTKATGVVHINTSLSETKIEQQQIEKRHAIVISGEGGSFVVGTNDAKLGSDWLTALKASSSKPQSSLELKGEVAKMGIMMKAKKKHCWKSCNLCSW